MQEKVPDEELNQDSCIEDYRLCTWSMCSTNTLTYPTVGRSLDVTSHPELFIPQPSGQGNLCTPGMKTFSKQMFFFVCFFTTETQTWCSGLFQCICLDSLLLGSVCHSVSPDSSLGLDSIPLHHRASACGTLNNEVQNLHSCFFNYIVYILRQKCFQSSPG